MPAFASGQSGLPAVEGIRKEVFDMGGVILKEEKKIGTEARQGGFGIL